MMTKTEKRLGVFPVLATAVLITVGVLSYQKTRSLIEANQQVTQSNEVLTEVSTLLAAIQGAQNNAHDYGVTHDRRFQDQYYSDVGLSQLHLDRLRARTARESAQQARLETLDPLVENAFSLFHVGMHPFPGLEPTGEEVARRCLREQEGMDGVRRILHEIESEEHHLLDQRNATAAADARDTKRIVILGSLCLSGCFS